MHSGGELVVVEYGSNEPLATVRTELMSPYLLSVAYREARAGTGAAGVGAAPAVKLLAYLADLYTVRVLDLATGGQLMQVAHESKIDWLVSAGMQGGGRVMGGAGSCITGPTCSSVICWCAAADMKVNVQPAAPPALTYQ
jgi:hypothetical protein